MNPSDFGNPLTFPPAPLWGSHLWIRVKCLNYWMAFHEIWYRHWVPIKLCCAKRTQSCKHGCSLFASCVYIHLIRPNQETCFHVCHSQLMRWHLLTTRLHSQMCVQWHMIITELLSRMSQQLVSAATQKLIHHAVLSHLRGFAFGLNQLITKLLVSLHPPS